jgi:hypothetical protein
MLLSFRLTTVWWMDLRGMGTEAVKPRLRGLFFVAQQTDEEETGARQLHAKRT